MKKARKLYESTNGDRWYLIRDPAGAVFVRHEANVASGGHVVMSRSAPSSAVAWDPNSRSFCG